MQRIISLVAAGHVGLTGFALGAVAADSPAKVCARYVESLKQADMTVALSLSARFPKLTDEEMRRLTAKVAAALRAQPMTILAEPSKTLDDCAVVIGKQSATDLDPVFMLKQGGQWRVLPTITGYDNFSFNLSEAQRGRYQELQAWFKAQKAENYRKVSGAIEVKDFDKQVTVDVNDVAAAVSSDTVDQVVHFLVFGTSGRKGDVVISTLVARNELNRIDGQEGVQLPLARLMRRMALRTESAQDARQYAFAKLKSLAAQNKEIKDMMLQTATEISKRENDDLKTVATNYLKNPN